MSRFTAIDLTQIPFPETVREPSFETELASLKADFIQRMPEAVEVLNLESEPLTLAFEMFAEKLVLLLGLINDDTRKNTLAHGFGTSLDNFAANTGVVRSVVQVADPNANPPVPEILENDDRFRRRIQLSLEGFTTCGTVGSYLFWSLAASPDVKNISVKRLEQGDVQITVLSEIDQGVAPAALLQAVEAEITPRRPLSDNPIIQSAGIQTYGVEASLTLYDGYDTAATIAAARTAVQKYTEDHHQLGHDITQSGLLGALHVVGVHSAALTSPAASLVIAPETAAYCTGVNVVFGGRDV